jgi:large subunit ribosomal protein L15|tara:strand:- start:7564 stop:8013 length:450 start_codon:yes stop_codon:yes gene_type:complete
MAYTLKYKEGSISNRKRIGRGNATGQGKTAGKGHNGYKARSGTKAKFHFEGGQTPLMRRLPKRGMKIFSKVHRYKNNYQIINLEKLSNLKVSKIDHDFLYKNNLIKSNNIPLKVLSKGDLDKPLEISANFFSKIALEKIEKAGGKAIFI